MVKELGYGSGAVTSESHSGSSPAVADGVNEEKQPPPFASSLVSSALTKYRNNFWQDNLGMCGFWLPMDLIIYSVPLHMRLHLNHGISFAWVALVSIFRGQKDEA